MDPRNDRTVVLAVVIGLIAIILFIVGGAFWLLSVGRTVPDSLLVMGSGALGALTALLATTASKPTPAQIEAAAPVLAAAPNPPDGDNAPDPIAADTILPEVQ